MRDHTKLIAALEETRDWLVGVQWRAGAAVYIIQDTLAKLEQEPPKPPTTPPSATEAVAPGLGSARGKPAQVTVKDSHGRLVKPVNDEIDSDTGLPKKILDLELGEDKFYRPKEKPTNMGEMREAIEAFEKPHAALSRTPEYKEAQVRDMVEAGFSSCQAHHCGNRRIPNDIYCPAHAELADRLTSNLDAKLPSVAQNIGEPCETHMQKPESIAAGKLNITELDESKGLTGK